MAKKLVHWALETLGSPSLPSLKLPGNSEDESSTESSEENNTATLQYVNSQLLAHGFTYQPGLSLEGTSKEDVEKVLKCLVGMLSQRVVRLNSHVLKQCSRTNKYTCCHWLHRKI